jgi:hypothetical protein
MLKSALLLATTILAVTAVSAMVYADSDGSSGSMMRNGMMGGGMMGRMSRMMSGCGAMMHGDSPSGRPNDQWRKAPNPQN